jgi:hypothetical protein
LQSVGDRLAGAFLAELIPEEVAVIKEKNNGFDPYKFRPAPPVEKLTEGKLEIKSLFRLLRPILFI